MQGRKPVPDAIKKATGNPGKRALNIENLMAPPELPEMPKWLKAEARAEWKRITEDLHKLGLLQRVDRPALTMYCRIWARWVYAEKQLSKGDNYLDTTPNNFKVQSTWLTISNRSAYLCMRLMGDFGMTPSSRTRLAIIHDSGEQGDLFDDWQNDSSVGDTPGHAQA